MALHVRQRGHNREQCFFSDADRVVYLGFLAFFARQVGCAIHAYCLMTNHVHLFLTPREETSCASLMKFLGQCYTQHINKTRDRSGSLWEGRYRSCPVADDRYALACYRYIELNPVRAGMVDHARDYRWSSHRVNAGGMADPMIEPHRAYTGAKDYRALFDFDLDEMLANEIRKATSGGYRVGSLRRARGRQMRKMGSVPI
ncbi:MAG: transposase [Burkholderiales bacterium]|nr:transposase [Burkholderiales bacterium]